MFEKNLAEKMGAAAFLADISPLKGASLTSRGVTFTISYAGGTGNDVVLTVTAIVKDYFLSEGATGRRHEVGPCRRTRRW
jgi:hypothetical protein